MNCLSDLTSREDKRLLAFPSPRILCRRLLRTQKNFAAGRMTQKLKDMPPAKGPITLSRGVALRYCGH